MELKLQPEDQLKAALKHMVNIGNFAPVDRNWDGMALAWANLCRQASGLQPRYYANCLEAIPHQSLRTETPWFDSPYGSYIWYNNESDGNLLIHMGNGELLGVGKVFRGDPWFTGAGIVLKEPHPMFYVGWSIDLT